MINERSIEFVNKFFCSANSLIESGVNLNTNSSLNMDKAMICIVSVPSDDDGVVTVICHMTQTLIKLDRFMSNIGALDLNASWAYSMADAITRTFKAKLDECYVQLKKNRGDGFSFGDSEINKVFKGHQGRMD